MLSASLNKHFLPSFLPSYVYALVHTVEDVDVVLGVVAGNDGVLDVVEAPNDVESDVRCRGMAGHLERARLVVSVLKRKGNVLFNDALNTFYLFKQ